MADAAAWEDHFVPGVVPWPGEEGGITLDNNSGISSIIIDTGSGGAGADIDGPGGTNPEDDGTPIPDPEGPGETDPEEEDPAGGSPAVSNGGSPGESTGALVRQVIRSAEESTGGFDIMRFIPILAAAGVGLFLFMRWKQ